MAADKSCCFIGRGEGYISSVADIACGWGTQWGLNWGGGQQVSTYIGRSIGNMSQLNITPNFSTVQNVQRAGLINNPDCAAVVINGFDIEMTFSCLNKENLQLALYGNQSSYPCPSGPVQECVASPGDTGFPCDSVIHLKSPNFDPSTLVIMDLTNSTTWVEGVDYQVTNFGIKMLKSYLMNVVLDITYELTADSFSCIEAYTQCPEPVRIVFDGFNLADKDECFYIEMYSVLLNPGSFPFITDDFAEITLTGILLPNENITQSNQSKFYKICYRDKG